jgi:hypothetical protein
MPKQASYLRGKKYNLGKKQGEQTDLTFPQNEGKSQTAARLASEYKVSRATCDPSGSGGRVEPAVLEIGVRVSKTWCHNLKDPSGVVIRDIQVARLVLSESRDGETAVEQDAGLPTSAGIREPANDAAAQIAVEVNAV